MSKYIKQDDIFELVRTGVLVSNGNFESVCKHIGSLPTIEVSEEELKGCDKVDKRFSEDAISRKDVEEMLDDAWVDGYEYSGNLLSDLEKLPSVIPKTQMKTQMRTLSAERCGVMTNADVIRKMTDKQLFDFLSEWEIGDIDYAVTFCDLCEADQKQGGKGNVLGLDCDGCREHWLNREASEYGGLYYWKKNTTIGE